MQKQINDLSTKKVFTLGELCQYTGMKASWVYKLTHSHKIPFSRPGGKLLFFEREKIESWLLSNPSLTSEEIDRSASNHVSTH